MSRFISNVVIATDTFNSLISKTNQLLHSHSVEILTTTNTAIGANTSGNTNIIGTFTANVLSTPVIKGGLAGDTSNTSTLTIGFSNSTVTSNVRVVGYAANINSNNLLITSNTTVNTHTFNANLTNFLAVSSNTMELSVGNTTNKVLSVTGNTTYSLFNVRGSNALVNTSYLYVESTSRLTGNLVVQSNSTVDVITVSTNNTTTNTTIGGNLVTVSANVTVTGTSHNISGNVNFDSNTLFIDSVNNRIGVGTNAPTFGVHVVGPNSSPMIGVQNSLDNTYFDLISSNSVTGTPTIIARAGPNTNLILAANNAGGSQGWIALCANGNVGVGNASPDALVTIGAGTKVYSNGTVQTFGDLICTGDLYANIVFMGGTNQATVTATVCPIVPPETIYNAAEPGPYSFLQFSNTEPKRIDVIQKAQNTGYQAVKYTLQIQDNEEVDEVMLTEVSMVYGYGNAHSTQFGTIFTNTAFVEVSVGANSTDYWIQANPTAAYLSYKGGTANLQFRGIRQKCR